MKPGAPLTRILILALAAGLPGCATLETLLEVAAPIAEGFNQGMAGSSAATYQAARSSTCGGYPLQTIGTAPAGYVCRCSYAPGASSPGWWAVRPGDSSGGAVACSAPSGSASANSSRYPMPPAPGYGSAPNRGGAPTGASGSRVTLNPVNQCVSIDRSNSLGDFITNRCSYRIAVWYCVRDRGHSFECGSSGYGNGVDQMTYVGANAKSATLKARNYSVFACGGPGLNAHLVSADIRWTGTQISGSCYTTN